MNNLEIASLRELNDEKLIAEYYKGKTNYEWENSGSIDIPNTWPFFYLDYFINNSDKENQTS